MITLFKCLKGCQKEEEETLFFLATSNRTQGHGLIRDTTDLHLYLD